VIIQSREDAKIIHWGNGTSHRFLLAPDGMGFSVCHTVVWAGTKSKMEYRRHREACYCISGHGIVTNRDGSIRHKIVPGVLYALDEHDAHILIADPDSDLELISIFNPPLHGDEQHDLDSNGFSQY
jgi:L-ectoine synthase